MKSAGTILTLLVAAVFTAAAFVAHNPVCMGARGGALSSCPTAIVSKNDFPSYFRFSTPVTLPVILPREICSSDWVFYDASGNLAECRNRHDSVNMGCPRADSLSILRREDGVVRFVSLQNSYVKKSDDGMIIVTPLHEWHLKTGVYVLIVEFNSITTVAKGSQNVSSSEAFSLKEVGSVQLKSAPVIIEIP